MRVLQASHRMPVPPNDSRLALVDHIVEVLNREFYNQLDLHLKETPGGIILGPPKVTQKIEDNWLFERTGQTIVMTMSATVEDLPEPPEYRFIGGPADGRIMRTRGERTWLIPVAPPPMGISSYADLTQPIPRLVAEYERQGDTGAYFYRRTYES